MVRFITSWASVVGPFNSCCCGGDIKLGDALLLTAELLGDTQLLMIFAPLLLMVDADELVIT